MDNERQRGLDVIGERLLTLDPPTPMLMAIASLGPKRVRYVGPPPAKRAGSYYTSWWLDGARATEKEMYSAWSDNGKA